LAVVLLAVPLALVLQRNYRDEGLLRLQRDTVVATRAIDLPSSSRDAIELPASGDRLAVYDSAGRRVAGHGPAAAPDLVRATLRTGRPTDSTQANRLVVAVPLLTGERVTGAVRAERNDAEAAQDTHQAWAALAGAGAAIVAGAVVAALLLGRRLARPLERLAASATRLGEGDFSVRAPRAGVREVDAVGAALDSTAERLDALVSHERAFSADASHQLRTPLAALRLELEAMELRGAAPPELTAALGQVERLQKTIDTLLALARDAPKREVEADLTAALDELEARWRGVLAAEGRPLRVLITSRRPVAQAAPSVVGELLEVLVDNAHEHGAGEVTLTVRDIERWLAVDVADQGSGFPGDPEQSFERRTGSASGHGIGLALARSLAHAEGGRLSVTDAGPRPVVTLLLPRRGAAPTDVR
jgi:signal transduction histidine kinase